MHRSHVEGSERAPVANLTMRVEMPPLSKTQSTPAPDVML